MKFILRSLFVLFSILFINKSKAQISGVFNIPANFPTFAAAINTLNLVGVAGPVTINVSAGYTETAPVGGYKLFAPVGVSAVNQVVFQKSGVGPNPLITAYAGTATTTSLVQDGVWWFIGADFITIDGIDVADPNTTNPATMEFGYGFYRATTTDGCQNNTIRNCVITMNKINGAAPSSTLINASGSRAIDFSTTYYTNNPLSISITSSAGANSNNKVHSNVIQNCHTCISLMANSINFPDQNNDLGGLSAVTGNTIVNFGGGSGGAAYGIRTSYQYSFNVANNVIENNNGFGSNPATPLTAVHVGISTTNNTDINYNTITLSSTANSSSALYGIYNLSGSSTGTVNINNNFFPSFSYTASNNVPLLMIGDNSSAKNLNINSNKLQNINVLSCQGTLIGSSNAATVSINSNTVANLSSFIANCNLINSYSANQTYISNNLIDLIYGTHPGSGNMVCISSDGRSAITNNTITNVSIPYIVGIENSSSGAAVKTISSNVLKNFNTYSGSAGTNFTGIKVWQAATGSSTIDVSANTIYSITSNGTSTVSAFGNLTGISFSISNGAVINGNKIYSLSSNTSGMIKGILLDASSCTLNNNIIGGLQISNSSQTVGISAVTFSTNNTYLSPQLKMYYNSIYLNNTSNAGTHSSTAALLLLHPNLSYTLNNNIFVNTSVPTGTGITSVVRKSNTSFGGWANGSNKNLFYAGSPSANQLLYYDGVNNYSTLFSLKSSLTPREAQSMTENPPFITTDGSLPNTLSIDPVIATQVESGGMPVSGITSDYAGNVRNTTTPDVGAWEGSYLQADVIPPQIINSGFIDLPCNVTNRTMTVSIKDTSGVATGSLAPRIYYRINFGLYTSSQGNLTAGTFTNGTWTFNLTYAASMGDVIYYFLAIQDQSYVNNLTVSPSVGASVADVNTVILPPVPANNYTLQTYPTISANNGTICSGQSFVIVPTGAVSYTYSSGSATVTPVATTNYSVTGFSSAGCPSTNTVNVSVTVLTSPTVSVNSGSICSGQSFTLTPSGAPSFTYSAGSPIVTPNSTTSYSVTGTNSLGCSNMAVATVTVNFAGITANTNTTGVCIGNPVILNGGGASVYNWSGGVTNNISFVPVSTTIYTVSATASNGCSGSATVQVLVYPLPTVSIVASNDSICVGESVTYTATGAQTYSWSGGTNIGMYASYTPSSSATFTVFATSVNGCSENSSVSVVVNLCTGIREMLLNTNISVYPNPSNGSFVIGIDNFYEKISIKIYNTLGQVILNEKLIDLANPINIREFANGIYHINIYQDNSLIRHSKIIKQ